MGPTGAGKTALSLAVCERLPCEIISVDSVLVYRGMDIGAARPSPGEYRRVPHHLVDILDPGETYSATKFIESATALVERVLAAGKTPLLVGGTMFYFHALEHGLDDVPDVGDDVKRELDEEERAAGLATLYAELQEADAAMAAQLHPHDSQRIKRALGVYRVSGRPLSAFQSNGGAHAGKTGDDGGAGGRELPSLPFPIVKFGLDFSDRTVLHKRIERRFDAMLEAGLVEEVARLMLRGNLNRDLPSMRAVGYAQVWSHLVGECDAGEMRERAVSATRQLAKRQLTWMRGMSGVCRREVDRVEPRALADEIAKAAA